MIVSCLGDSLTFGFGVVESRKWINNVHIDNVKFLNHGINGDTISSMVNRSLMILEKKPDYLFILGGINDFFIGLNVETVYENTIKIIENSIDYNVIPVIGIEMYPEYTCVEEGWVSSIGFKSVALKVEEYRKRILEYCKSNNLNVIDLYCEFPMNIEKPYENYFIDGIHPTGEGHMIMAKIIQKKFNNIINQI